MDYDSEGNLTRLWLTDSDDLQYGLNEDGLFAADVKIKNGKVYLSTQPVTWQEGNTIYSQTWYPEDEGTYIGSVCLLNPAAFTLVPEPTTASLSLMALVGLVARRRRK